MWNERFAGEGYVYGTEPAGFVKRHAGVFRPGMSVLSVADGEGRNSVWLAGQGMRVAAMDGAPNAVSKARKLADRQGVAVDFHVGDILEWDWAAAQHDVVLAVFIQFAPPPVRKTLFDNMKQAIKPGGLLLLHGYTPKQVEYGTGGPGCADFMYTPDLLRAAFAGYEVQVLDDYEAEIHEGEGHSGKSALIDCIVRKPL